MAELLILNRDATPEQRSYKRGDVVVVREDGHEWGRAEGLPDFIRASLPGVSVAAVEAALTMPHQIEAAESAPSAVRASMARLAAYVRAREPERITRRRYRVPSALLDAHVAGRITVALNNIEDKKRAP
jgi:hypothetical protein